MKKKIIIIILSICFVAGYVFLAKSVGNHNSLRNLKQLLPPDAKDFIKKNIFFYQYNKYIEKELKQLEEAKINNEHRQEFLNAVNEKKVIKLIENYGYIDFKKKTDNQIYNIDGKKAILEKFYTKGISVPKYVGKGTAYLEYDDGKLFIVSANGMFFFLNIDELNKNFLTAKVIKSNIRNKIKYDRFYIKSMYGLKDVFINKNKIFVSYIKQQDDTRSLKWRNNCYNTSILVADLNYEYLEFEELFSPKMCIKESDERYIEFLAHQSGGRIVKYKNDKLLFSIGEFRTFIVSQEKTNLFGKIISLDFNGSNPEIVSMGHRNPQGLFYDKKNDIIFSTEHGPDGGDEINYNLYPTTENVKNYGWPISSYGDHKYDIYDYQLYKLFPLHKSHSKYGFVEPLKYFYPSIGISEIIKLDNTSELDESHNLLVASMGGIIEEGDLSLHFVKTNKKFEVMKHEILKFNERIRDMKYVPSLNKVFLFFETAAAIGVLSLE